MYVYVYIYIYICVCVCSYIIGFTLPFIYPSDTMPNGAVRSSVREILAGEEEIVTLID